MSLTIAKRRAIPLLVLGAGMFTLAAVVDVPREGEDAAAPASIAALHLGAHTLAADPTACADAAADHCVIDAPEAGHLSLRR